MPLLRTELDLKRKFKKQQRQKQAVSHSQGNLSTMFLFGRSSSQVASGISSPTNGEQLLKTSQSGISSNSLPERPIITRHFNAEESHLD